MTVFITGGCKNGKSTFALQCALSLSERRPRYYVATMEPPCDADELERIRIHRAARAGKGFVTLEQGRNLPVCLEQADHSGVFCWTASRRCWPMRCSPPMHSLMRPRQSV